jgi:hypothetical protein
MKVMRIYDVQVGEVHEKAITEEFGRGCLELLVVACTSMYDGGDFKPLYLKREKDGYLWVVWEDTSPGEQLEYCVEDWVASIDEFVFKQ